MLGEVRVANLTKKTGPGEMTTRKHENLLRRGHISMEWVPQQRQKVVSGLYFEGGGVFVPVHFGSVKTSKEKAVVVMCNDFSKGT